MELIAPGEVCAIASAFHPPRVLTNDRVARLTTSNTAARAVRGLGFKVMSEDVFPDDGGTPILLINLDGLPLERLLRECDTSVKTVGGNVTGRFRGVRVVVQGAEGEGRGH